MIARAGEAAGFDVQIHPHMLRHACGYKLANDGADSDRCRPFGVRCDEEGKPAFNDLLFRKREPVYIPFDVLNVEGADERGMPLNDRRARASGGPSVAWVGSKMGD